MKDFGIKIIALTIITFLTISQLFSQTLYISSSSGEFYELDVSTCSVTFVGGPTWPFPYPYDITFHPNGKFYYLNVSGLLLEYDFQDTTHIYQFDAFGAQNWTSLVTDGNGLFYASGTNGELWTYDLNTQTSNFLGSIETPSNWVAAAGDLTFYKGGLYVAGTGDQIVKINIDSPENSELIMEEDLDENIWGIVSYASSCDCQEIYALTSGYNIPGWGSIVYQIDFENQQLDSICRLDFPVTGGATSFEFWGSFPISVQNIETIDAGCDTNNGSIVIDAIGGVGQLTYSIDGVSFQTTNQFTDLTAGVYTITIKDENDCPIVDTVIIEEGSLQIIDILSTNEICGSGNGEITINANGGIGQLEYSINGVDFQTNNVFNNLLAGNYTVTVQDGNNCSDTESITINLIEAPQIVDIDISDETCGNANGSITITSNGGTGQLEYSIGGIVFQVDNIFENLLADTYMLVVQDENNCTDTTTFEIGTTNSPEISNIISTEDSCESGNGSITAFAMGGNGQLVFSINGIDYQTSNLFDNLSAGIYTVSVQDNNNCLDTTLIEIQGTERPNITSILTTPITCNNSFGAIEFEGEGGNPPYAFSIDGINYQSIGFFNSLNQGIYTIIIQDSISCLDSVTIELNEEESPMIISIEVDHTTCDEDNGALQVEVHGGNSVQFSIDGINYQDENNFGNLTAGNYLVSLQDANNCIDTQSIFIAASEPPVIESIEVISALCGEANGSVLILTNGFGEGLEYSLNGSDFQIGNGFNNLQKGSYSIYVQDENGCLASGDFILSGSPQLNIDNLFLSFPNCGENNGNMMIEFEGGTGTIQVSLNNANYQATQSFNGLRAGDYLLVAIDEVGCKIDTIITLTNKDCPLYIPNAFSPNDDGVNDIFRIFPHPDFRGSCNKFRVFDRWGTLVFEANGFYPNDNIGWDGDYEDRRLNPGVYVYFIEVEFESGKSAIYEGEITLIR